MNPRQHLRDRPNVPVVALRFGQLEIVEEGRDIAMDQQTLHDFGLTHINLSGLGFVEGNVIRDLASLNRMEMLPWDVWGMMDIDEVALTNEKRTLIDRVAALTIAGDEKFGEVREIYESDDRLRVPPVVFNVLRSAPEPSVFSPG